MHHGFGFWNDHGIMNTSGLLQSQRETKGFTLTSQVTKVLMIPRTDLKLNLLLIFTFCYKYLKYK